MDRVVHLVLTLFDMTSGMPAAYFTTPAGQYDESVHHPEILTRGFPRADVVKTRLQTEAKTGQTHYKGMLDAFSKICEPLPGSQLDFD